MVKHYNVSLVDRLQRLFKWKGNESIDSQVSDYIQPVVEITPRINIMVTGGNASTAAVTVYTTPSTKDFYLTSIHVSYAKDATADNTEVYLSATLAQTASAINLLDFANLTTTASRDSQVIIFPIPILLARGTGIGLFGAFTVGALIKTAQITGYTEEAG